MRLNKLLVVALAGMTMFSCSNDDEPGNGASNGEKKTVVLKLDGIKSAKTRSTDGNTTGTENKAAMTVHDVTVVLYSNENKRIVLVDEIPYQKEGTTNSEWATLTGSGKHYANVDASANRVLVLGNVAKKEGIHKLLTEGADVQKVLDYDYLLKEENQKKGTADNPDDETDSNTKNYVTLYDNQALVEDGTVTDNTHSDQGNKLYKATLTIKPLVSRFEVKSVGCKFENVEGTQNTLYKKITLKGIGLVDYYTKAKVSAAGGVTATDAMHGISEGETTTDPGIYSPLHTGDVPEGSYKFCDENSTEWGWTFDIIGGDTDIAITNDNADGSATYFQDVNKKNLQFAYNFFPMHNDNDVYNTPNVRLYVNAENEDGNVDQTKHFVVTTSMRDSKGDALIPERGKIYQFDYVFKEKNIGKWEEKISVEVTVKVADWEIETVTPGFPD